MERLIEILVVMACLYAGYKLTAGKWNYTSQADVARRREALKEDGLSTRFYFIHARTQWVLTLVSGGLFTFYWFYRQWRNIRRGFRQADGQPLRGNAWWRTVGGGLTFFTLGNLINRTCEYMKKETSWPAGLWVTLWWGGLVLVFSPVSALLHVAGYALFCTVPTVFQRRINTLTRETFSLLPKPEEMLAAAIGLVTTLALAVLVRVCTAG